MNSQQQQDAVRASITETISELDGLREKIDEYDWDECAIEIQGVSDQAYTDIRDFLVKIHNAYPALRRAAMAGVGLAKAVEGIDLRGIQSHWEQRDAALATYRSAIEEKNV